MAMAENTRGALLMVGSMTAFTLNDAFMKSLAGTVPLPQAIFLRGLATTVLLYLLAQALGHQRLKVSRRDWLPLVVRTVAEIGAVFLFLTALFNMPIANATAILQALPLTVTLAAALFLREPIGWRRVAAIVVGFGGVLLIVQPGTDGFTVYSLYALGAVVAVTLRDLAVRRMSRDLPTVTVALTSAAGVTLAAGLVSSTQAWAPIDGGSLFRLGAAALFILAAYVLSVAAMRVGEIAVVSPFRYSGLLAALLVGIVAFGERPDIWTYLGATLVVVSGLFALWRERLLAGRKVSSPQAKAAVDTPADSH